MKTVALLLLWPVAILCAESPTTSIRVDQVGYLTGAPKLAIILGNHAAQTFLVKRSSDGIVVFQGRLTAPVLDPDSGDRVQTADFSRLQQEGKFYVDVPQVGRSWDFNIGPDVFRYAYFLAMRSYLGQRCGTAVDLSPDFPQYKHSACHLVGAYNASSGKVGPRVSTHGWHDAGDYGRYVVNSGISTGTLLWTYELFGDRIRKISLHLPDSRPGTPDILTEIRWNLDWMLTMQDTDGGVWQKQTSTHFCGFIMPEADKLPSEVIGTGYRPFKSSCATADFAAVMAIAARLYRPLDTAYSQRVLQAAQGAWRWVEKNPNVVFHNPPGVSTGEYGDANCGDERLWAAAELLRATGDAVYSQYFLAHYREYLDMVRAVGPQSWSMVAPLALWTYVLGNGKDVDAVAAIRQRSVSAADQIVDRAGHNAYRLSLAPSDFIWGSNGVAANYSMQLLIANRFRPDPRYMQTALDNLHYILGRNAFSLSWVTQLGEHPFQHPHHRPSAADGIDAPWPGLMSGGPNPGRQDAVMKKMVDPDTPRAKAYVDETGAYACNEVAINWNAPLVFTLAATVK